MTEKSPIVEQQPIQITFKNLFKNTLEMVSFWARHQKQVSLLGSLTFVGLMTAFPERFKEKDLLYNSNFPIFDQIVNLGVQMNDWIDMSPLRKIKMATDPQAKETTQPYFQDILQKWQAIVKVLYGERNQGGWVKPLADSYQREIIRLNRTSAQLSDDELTFGRALELQELEDAISLVHNAAVWLGPDALPERLSSLGKAPSIAGLKEKYAWMVENRWVNETERRLCALFNLVMITQMYDHWYDCQEDSQLGLRTPATKAMQICGDSQNKAWQMIKKSIENYSSRAQTLGVSRGAIRGIALLENSEKTFIQKAVPRVGGKRHQLLSNPNTA